MSRFSWFSWLRRPARDSHHKPQRALRGERFRPRVEVLEDRTLLSAYLVNAPGDAGTGSGTSGDLRWCITQANSDPTPNTITFNTAATTSTILTQGTLEISNSMTITGPGAGNLTVQRDGTTGAFSVFTVDAGATVTISGLTISGGSASSNGGGISNGGTLTVSDSTLSGNSAYRAGGIYNQGSLTVSDSTLSNNTATSLGGGIFNWITGSLTVSDSTLFGNSAVGDGGAIYNRGSLTVSDSTLAGNTASGLGGGIYAYQSSSQTVSNSTLSGNSASYGGGGILNYLASVALRNTVVAGNTLLDGVTASDIAQDNIDVANSWNNLIGTGGSGGLSPGVQGNQVGVSSPGLAPLGNYGGPTQTMALLPGSPAIDAGSNAFVSPGETDQRGLPRIANAAVDIGAFEYYSPLVVTTNLDEDNGSDSLTSLREAISYADGLSGHHDITFAPWVTGTIDLTSALPDLSADVTIQGPGATVLTVERHVSDPFSVFTVDPSATVTISGLTISGGSAQNGGGGIFNQGSLTVNSSTLSGNAAYAGAGIYSDGSLTVSSSTLSDNTATHGGAIYSNGPTIVDNSMLSRNTATNSGAGIDNAGTLTVTDSTLSGNSVTSSGGYGGGIDNSGVLSISDSTLSGDSASNGGGIYDSNVLTITGGTLSGNTAAQGGGIYIELNGGVVLRNTLVAGNTLPDGITPSDIYGSVDASSSWNNLIGTGGSGGLSPGVQGNQVGVGSPGLAPLGNYGGPTQTMALLPGSPAIDTGSNTFVTSGETDQRGLPRIANGTVDIGAFEYSPLVVTTNLDENNSSDNLTSLREAISYADTLSGHHDITFAPWVTGAIDLTSALPDLSADVGIVGPGANSLNVQRDAAAAAFSVFTVDAGATVTISGLTISGGSASYGGGVRNAGTLTVSDSILSGNSATSAGGGISNTGSVTVSNSTLVGNSADVGAGISNTGSVTVSNSTLVGNSANVFGGGIVTYAGSVTISGSTVAANTSNSGGGGIANFASMALRNTLGRF